VITTSTLTNNYYRVGRPAQIILDANQRIWRPLDDVEINL
jgi:hypothetical protein